MRICALRLPELLLMRVDKMSMGVSLEARVPFLDHEFVTLAMSIPSAVKTRNGILKYILKKAVRGVIPDELIDRPKQGFGVPIHEWLFAKLGDFARRELMNCAGRLNFLDERSVELLFRADAGGKLWFLLNSRYGTSIILPASTPSCRNRGLIPTSAYGISMSTAMQPNPRSASPCDSGDAIVSSAAAANDSLFRLGVDCMLRLWTVRLFLLKAALVGGTLGLIIGLLLPKEYVSTTRLMPA